MADPIIRLRVESKEFDSKIKRASDGLLELETSCKKAGKSMTDVDKATVDYVRQIGRMDTVNRTAKGSVNELQRSFVELSAQYNRLTEQEKRSPFGQALSQSIETLRGRVQQGRQELDNINQSLNGTSSSGNKASGVLDSLAGKFGLNASQLMKFGGALGAAKMALDVAKDAFFANEQQLDEWGRICESSRSVYNAFLDSLNHGDVSGFLSRIDSIVKAARDAYDALDELNTYNAFNQINVERTKTGLNNAIADYREGKGGKAGVQTASDAYIKELQQRQKREQEAYKAAVYNLAKTRGVSGSDLMNALSGNYGDYTSLKNLPLSKVEHIYRGGPGGQYHTTRNVPANARERMGEALRSINDTQLQEVQALGLKAEQTANEIAASRKQVARIMSSGSGTTTGTTRTGRGGGGGHTGGGTTAVPKTEQQLNNEAIAALNQEYISATEERKTAIKGEIKVLQDRNAEIQRLIDESNGKVPEVIPEGSVRALTASMADLKKKQQDVTSPADWTRLQGEIDGVQRKINDIMGVVEADNSVFSAKNLQALISNIKQQLDESTIGTDFYDTLTGQLADANAFSNLLGEFIKNGIDLAEVDAQQMWHKIFGGEDVATEELQAMLDKLNAYLAEHGLDVMQLGNDGSLSAAPKAEKKKDPVDTISKGMSGLQSVLSGIQQTGIKIPPAMTEAMNVMQGLISVVQGVQTIISLFSTTSQTANTTAVLANTAAVGALTTVMTANTAASIIPFKTGGIVPRAATGLVAGHDFSDNTPVMVSSGELILNRAQQGNIASQLEGSQGVDGLHLETKISAEEFRVMLNSNSRRRGRGEYVTSRG